MRFRWDLWTRLWVCFLMACCNFLSLELPVLGDEYFRWLIAIGLMINVVVASYVLWRIPPINDMEVSSNLFKISKIGVSILVYGGVVIMVFAALKGVLHHQMLPFLVFGFIFSLLPAIMLERSLRVLSD